MKTLTLLLTLLGYSEILSQISDKRFDNFQGLRNLQNGDEFLEAEGYDIFTYLITYKLDEKGMSKFKKKHNLKNSEPEIDSTLNLKVFRSQETKFGLTAYTNIYLLPFSNGNTRAIGFSRAISTDIELERGFIISYQKDLIPPYVYVSTTINELDFVGRTIELGPTCHWMNPHNVQCPNYGQMNWAIFDNLKDAEQYRDSRLTMIKNRDLINLKEEKWVAIKFEGQETQALRTKLKVQVPKLVMGGSNILVAYYVTAKVRGKYVTCILSHYTDDVGANTLPPLLREVMELVE